MIRLVQTFGAHAGRTREFDQDVITFGRLPTNDVAFDPHADLDASGAHAEIRREGIAWVLVDSRSRNGTLIQGRVIQRHTLSHGEEIEFGTGGPRIRFELAASANPAPAPRPGMPTMPATPIDASPSPPQPGEPKLYGQHTLDAAVEAANARAGASPAAWPPQQGWPGPAQAGLAQPPAQTPRGTAVMPYGAAPIPAPLPTPAYITHPLPPPVAPSQGANSTSLWIVGGALASLGCLSLFCILAAGAILYFN